MLTTRRIYRTTIAIALAGALVAPAASVADDHWAWTSSRPDATPTEARQDLRSPDTRDAAMGRGTWSVPDVTVVTLPQPAPAAERGTRLGRRRHRRRDAVRRDASSASAARWRSCIAAGAARGRRLPPDAHPHTNRQRGRQSPAPFACYARAARQASRSFSEEPVRRMPPE